MGWGAKRDDIFGGRRRWVGSTEEREREIEAVAKGGGCKVFEGTMARSF